MQEAKPPHRSQQRLGVRILLATAFLTALSLPAAAASIAYTFGGTLNQAFGALPAGTAFSGGFRYDTNAAPVISFPAAPPYITQDYPFEEFFISIDGQTISAVPGSDFRNNVGIGLEGSDSHRFLIIASDYSTGGPDILATGPVGGVENITHISILLDDDTKTALSDTAPPETLALADFATYRLFYIGSHLNEHFASGTITYLRPVPLPGAIGLFLAALASGAFLSTGKSWMRIRRRG